MNMNKYLIVLSISLLISIPALRAAPFAYVASENWDIIVIDVATNNIVADINLPPFTASLGNVALTPNNKFGYISDTILQGIRIIDLATNTFLPTTISTGVGSNPFAVVTSDGNFVLVTDFSTANVTIIAISTNTVIQTVSLAGKITNPNYVAIAPDGKTAYVTDSTTNKVVAIDISNLPGVPTVGTPFTVGTQPNQNLVVTSNNNLAYIVNNDGHVYPVTGLPGAPVVEAGISVGTLPVGIALTSDNKTAYVSNSGSNTVTIINGLPSTPTTVTIGVGTQPQLLALTSDNRFLYVPAFIGNEVNVFDTSTNLNVSGTPIVLGPYQNPFDIAITTSTFAPTNVIGKCRKNVFLDKTERILVITWTASSSMGIVSYNIYNGTTLIGNVLATAPLAFNALLTKCDNGQNFSITAVSSLGGEGPSTPVVVQ